MPNESWEDLVNKNEVGEIQKKISDYSVSFERAPGDFSVSVWKHHTGDYYGIANYRFWGPEQALPYISIHAQRSELEALEDAIRGIQSFYSSKFPDDAIYWEKYTSRHVDIVEKVYIDGSGKEVTQEDAEKRRAKYSMGKNKK